MKSIAFALGGVMALGLAGAASAGEWSGKFAEMDIDADGAVTAAEFTAHKSAQGDMTQAEIDEAFASLAGTDAVLTLAEYEAYMSAHSKARAASDTDEPAETGMDDET